MKRWLWTLWIHFKQSTTLEDDKIFCFTSAVVVLNKSFTIHKLAASFSVFKARKFFYFSISYWNKRTKLYALVVFVLVSSSTFSRAADHHSVKKKQLKTSLRRIRENLLALFTQFILFLFRVFRQQIQFSVRMRFTFFSSVFSRINKNGKYETENFEWLFLLFNYLHYDKNCILRWLEILTINRNENLLKLPSIHLKSSSVILQIKSFNEIFQLLVLVWRLSYNSARWFEILQTAASSDLKFTRYLFSKDEAPWDSLEQVSAVPVKLWEILSNAFQLNYLSPTHVLGMQNSIQQQQH